MWWQCVGKRDSSCVPAPEVRAACSLPVLVGSGVTADNVATFRHAHGLIVGSEFKRNAR